MAKLINFQNTTLVTGTPSPSSEQFLLVTLNDKQIGLPIIKLEANTTDPNIEIIELGKMDFVVEHSVLQPTATNYNFGISLTINNSSFAIPAYKVQPDNDNFINLKIINPTISVSLLSSDYFIPTKLSGEVYGIPLFTFENVYQNNKVVPASGINITTTLVTDLINDTVSNSGSTNLNSKIKSYSKLIERVKRSLGWPNININICDENIVEYIDQALEYFTKYSGFTEEYLLFSTSLYKRGFGIRLDELFSKTPEMRNSTFYNEGSASFDYDLDNYRKVIDVFSFEHGEGIGINTLFTLEQAMVQQTYYGYMLGSTGFDLITWEVLKGWLDTRKKVLAQIPYIRFDNKTQIMKIIPEPFEGQQYCGVVGCHVERRVKDLISEPWVIEYTLALTSIALGRIYGKFTGMALPIGGGSINYTDPLSYGLKRKEELEKELVTGLGLAETDPPFFFIG